MPCGGSCAASPSLVHALCDALFEFHQLVGRNPLGPERPVALQLDARNAMGLLLLDRSDEFCLLAERAHAQEAVLQKGAALHILRVLQSQQTQFGC